MEYQANKIGELKWHGEVYEVAAPLDKQIQAFANVGITAPFIVSPDEVAQIRLSGISTYGTRTSMAPLSIKGGKTILFRDSPLMNPLMAATAVQLHRNNEYLTMSKEAYEYAKAIAESQTGMEPEDRTALIVSKEGDFDITPEMDEAEFTFRKQNKPYFDKFTSGKIRFYNLQGDSKDKTTGNYLWFLDPRGGSDLYARSRGLNLVYGAFGVLRSAEGSAQNSGYNLIEIGKANSEIIPVVFDKANISGLADMVSRDLNKSLLAKLRSSKQ